jgi:hypothetical protein
MLRKHHHRNSNKKASFLQQNLFVALTSEEIFASSLHIAHFGEYAVPLIGLEDS